MEFCCKKVLAFLIFILSISAINAQKPTSSSTPPIPENQDDGIFDPYPAIVSLTASVLDNKGKYVNGLTYKDFKVYDKGKPQEISYFLQDMPVSVGFLFELSFAMDKTKDGSRILFDGKEIKSFIKKSNPKNDYFLMGFDSDSYLLKRNESTIFSSETTRDFNKIKDSLSEISKIKVKGDSNAFDVLLSGFEKFVKNKNEKKIFVLITDGVFDACGSRPISMDFWKEIHKQNNTIVYVINFRNLVNIRPSDSDLSEYLYIEAVSLTGGKMFFPTNSKELVESFEAIADEIRSQYTLGYSPLEFSPKGKWHKTKIELKLSKEKKKEVGKVFVRTQEGYLFTF